ncbi:hypothetical protein [Marinobacter arenosus]|uniref:hypothetical protein n=1 Tax=Marinobacter arenosus TaxID=2856822 RepID=UPI001C4D7C85|nr:hypothetical protein [Marinobacter arenosus]MBW0146176.1 hypothetical protein [Marinobacter arenosus]
MIKAHKDTSQKPFLLRRKLGVDGLGEAQWDDLIYELDHHPCVDFAERRPNDILCVTYDGTHWSMEPLQALIEARGGRIRAGWWARRRLAWYQFTDDNVRVNAGHES